MISHELSWPSNHLPPECLFNSFLGLTSKKYQSSALLTRCEGNPPLTGAFPSQRAQLTRKASSSSLTLSRASISCVVCALLKWGSWVSISKLWDLNIFIVTNRSVIWRKPPEFVQLRSVWTIICLAFIHMKLQRSFLILQTVCVEIVRSSMCQRSQRTGGSSLELCWHEKEHKRPSYPSITRSISLSVMTWLLVKNYTQRVNYGTPFLYVLHMILLDRDRKRTQVI